MQLNQVGFYAGSIHYQTKVNMEKAYETIYQNSDVSEGERLRHNPIRNRAFSVFNGRCTRLTLKGHCHVIWQLNKKLESVFASIDAKII